MSRRSTTLGLLCLAALTALSVAGCGTATPAATPTATRTPAPAAPLASSTPEVPKATSESLPTPTVTPAPSATPDDSAATPFPPDVNPLTGLRLEDPSPLDRIPVAIKVSNSPEVRPQSGLGSADLVFEHFAEGGITRYTAVFYGASPEMVGSVRSGRLIDLEVPAMYQAIFGYSGSSAGVKERIRNSDLFPDRIAAPDFGVGEPYFYRVPQEGKAFEHTLFSDPEVLRELASERGIDGRPDFGSQMSFSEATPAGGEPVTYFEVNYLTGTCTGEWEYLPESATWGRSIAGTAHTDALTGRRVTAANILVVFANHVYTDILEDTWGGGHMSIEVQVWGQGSALLFRDGQMFSGLWQREARDDMLTFYYGDGSSLPLKPGNSWIQLVPLETEASRPADGQVVLTPPKM